MKRKVCISPCRLLIEEIKLRQMKERCCVEIHNGLAPFQSIKTVSTQHGVYCDGYWIPGSQQVKGNVSSLLVEFMTNSRDRMGASKYAIS